MELSTGLKEIAASSGADFFGIAELAPAREAGSVLFEPEMAVFQRGVSMGIGLKASIVNDLQNHPDVSVSLAYRRHRDEVSAHLDQIASRVARFLEAEGHTALPIPASRMIGKDRTEGAFSHKMAAHLAGLGWIGKSCLLITPEAGPRVRWVTVLTDARLEATGSTQNERCGKCEECVKICPSQAFTGEPFRMGEPREVRFDALACRAYHNRLEKGDVRPICGLCVYVCPHGRKRSQGGS